jgi:stage III sporulation protein AB
MNIANSLKNNSDFVVCLNEYLENKKFNFDKKYLSLEEKEFFRIYLSNIGIHDKATQMDYIAGIDGRIEEYYSNAKNDEKKYKTLYIKLGLLFGLMLFIILI